MTHKKASICAQKAFNKRWTSVSCIRIHNTDTKHYEQTCKLDRKSTIIFKRNISVCLNVTIFYKQSFYHPLFSKDSQERLTYILVKNILLWMCTHFWWYVFLKWLFFLAGQYMHTVCDMLANCLLFVTAQNKYCFK